MTAPHYGFGVAEDLDDARSLLDLPLVELMEEASRLRDESFGRRVTYSPKVFVPLTMLCNDRCGYCTFAKPPARLDSPYMSMEQVIGLARRGAASGCHEVLFTLGERPEDRYPQARTWLTEHGFSSTVDYLASACAEVLEETGLLPHTNAGALLPAELSQLRCVSVSQGMMLESLNPELDCHRASPDKTPQRRLATLQAAGEAAIPFTTGILVGIGEQPEDILDALIAIAHSHLRYGHIQEVIVQNFLPKAGTTMHARPPCTTDDHLRAIAMARILLPLDIHLQAPPNLSHDLSDLLNAGIDDWGGVSPVTLDHVNPERPWPAIERIEAACEKEGFVLAPRLALHPAFALEPDRWLAPPLRFPVLDHSDSEGLARDHPWVSGGSLEPPDLLSSGARVGRRRGGSAVGEVVSGVLLGQEPGIEEIVSLFGARGSELRHLCDAADSLRAESVGDEVTWVANRNINYTNVCTFKCRFCAFSKGPLSLNLRGSPYLLGLDEITHRVIEAEQAGATEVCLQGGIHPDFDGDYYLEVIRAVREASPSIHIHGFTALEVTEGARRLGESLVSYLTRLRDAGLRTLPGTAAEILDDEVRSIICPDKIDTEQWLEAHRVAHSVGLRSNVTIMFGSVEQPRSWARHIVVTRELQKETGGFTEFVPLPFVHMASPIYLRKGSRRGPTFREALLMHAVPRMAYRGLIDNIQTSWVKMGLAGATQALRSGANDLGGTLMDENISRAAGASHGQRMGEEAFRSLVEPLGRTLTQRTTLYGRVTPPARACLSPS